jgi:hypothetical protein
VVQNGDHGVVVKVVGMDIVELELKRMMRMRVLQDGLVWMTMMSWMKDLMRFWMRIGMLGVIFLGEVLVEEQIRTGMGKARVKLVCIRASPMYDRLCIDRY